MRYGVTFLTIEPRTWLAPAEADHRPCPAAPKAFLAQSSIKRTNT